MRIEPVCREALWPNMRFVKPHGFCMPGGMVITRAIVTLGKVSEESYMSRGDALKE